MDWHIIYAKFDGCKSFKAFDINEGRQVGNLIYASLVENTEDTRQKLQKLADLNKGLHLVLQLCAATSQERQSVLSDKVKGNGQTRSTSGRLPEQEPSAHNFSFYGTAKRHQT